MITSLIAKYKFKIARLHHDHGGAVARSQNFKHNKQINQP